MGMKLPSVWKSVFFFWLFEAVTPIMRALTSPSFHSTNTSSPSCALPNVAVFGYALGVQ